MDLSKRIKCLHDGFVELIDHMGSDAEICNAARLSYGKDRKPQSDDRTLIRYLMRHQHTSPFEMAEVKFLVRVPIDIWRQWVRHRTASINEHSTRYTAPVKMQPHVPGADQWRMQDADNKQGSNGLFDEKRGSDFHDDFQYAATIAATAYSAAIKSGVSREQARSILPLSTYTEAVWKIDLHNLMHFIALRIKPNAQAEIREYAAAILDIVEELFPHTMEAFADYRLHALALTALDVFAIQNGDWSGERTFNNDRERREYVAKIDRLGIGPLMD